ncbi:MAG: TetR/AcrR family transcriptional regulator [Candidatus Caldatribacteriota bacterium]
MVRVIKEYEERKNELLDTAQELFFSQGYQQTSVEAIIKRVGVSKGTFYYYFKSKEDMLDQLVKRMTVQILKEVKKITERSDLDALTKLNKAYTTIRSVKLENIPLIKLFIKVLYNDVNIMLRHKIYMSNVELLVPEFMKIIQQGVEEGVFNTPFPHKAARIIFELGQIFGDLMTKQIFLEMNENTENINKFEKEIEAYEDSIERIVGVKKGKINIIDRNILKNVLEKFKLNEDEK